MRHITGETGKGDRQLSRYSLFVALWMLILVTLLSALAPIGPPLSRPTGSAFNPATSDVVIKARAPTPPHVAQAARVDGDDTPPILLFCIIATLALVASVGRLRIFFSPPQIAAAPLLLSGGHRARAPPAAF
ncbi:hypothetical protein OVY48_16120 [Sphingobium sp. SA2]|uniref:hypothetical protein n=1 Tax=Sphingobium sp. SA2 TaxID=1524832 RepID=UPI0028C1403A|nr:hypothetical protein [Sphingobium sp. SA2]MDT7534941.1 hypothetical protein [Sphingobium sp. SA2]